MSREALKLALIVEMYKIASRKSQFTSWWSQNSSCCGKRPTVFIVGVFQDLQGRVGQEAPGPLALLDPGVPQVTWGFLDHKVLLASLDTATPLHVQRMGWEVSASLLWALSNVLL